jgi:carnitine-CoA ligase
MKDFPLQQRDVATVLADKAARVPDATYLTFEDSVYTYGHVDELANTFAHGLAGRGIRKGARVALMMDNCPEYLWLTFALGKLGAVVVPINCAAKGQLLRYFVEDAGCTAAVIGAGYLETFRKATAGLGITEVVHVEDGAEPFEDLAGLPTLGDIAADGATKAATPPVATAGFTDPWFIMYTSGTTGPSKGVVSPHAHALTVGKSVTEMFGIAPEDRMYTFLPMFHGNALWYSSLVALWAEASIVLARRFSASGFWKDIRRFGCTEFNAIMAVSTILEKLPPVPEEQDNDVRLAFIVPLPIERQALEERWGCDIVCNYAMTEILPAAVLGPRQGYDRPGTSGVVSPFTDVKIVDEHDVEAAPGAPGEVVIRPKEPWTTFTEYAGKPEATAAAFRNLWFHTGDRAYIDDDGYFFFVDRIKDAIRRRGENISAHEIELVLEMDPRVAEAAAVPVPSEMGEDEVAVYVVRAQETLTERDVIDYAIDNMAYFMVPRYVVFIDEVPKTQSHKKAKYTLRDAAQSEYTTFWDREAHGIEVKRPQMSGRR